MGRGSVEIDGGGVTRRRFHHSEACSLSISSMQEQHVQSLERAMEMQAVARKGRK